MLKSVFSRQVVAAFLVAMSMLLTASFSLPVHAGGWEVSGAPKAPVYPPKELKGYVCKIAVTDHVGAFAPDTTELEKTITYADLASGVYWLRTSKTDGWKPQLGSGPIPDYVVGHSFAISFDVENEKMFVRLSPTVVSRVGSGSAATEVQARGETLSPIEQEHVSAESTLELDKKKSSERITMRVGCDRIP